MPTKITEKTKEFLLSVSLPEKTETYTPISHEFAINHITENLLNNNFIIKDECYRSTENGNVANGIFELNHHNDDDMQMICCFSNSYDKSTRFSVAVGAKVLSTGNYFLSDISWIRKHSGKADKEAEKVIQEQIKNAQGYFKKLQSIKASMQQEVCTKERYGSMIGQLFVQEFITVDQISECFKQWKSMEIDGVEEIEKIDLWKAYQFVLSALKSSHPSKWINNQIMTNMYVCNMFHIKAYMPGEVMQLDLEPKDDVAVPELSMSFVMPQQITQEDINEAIEKSEGIEKKEEDVVVENTEEVQEEIKQDDVLPNEDDGEVIPDETYDFEQTEPQQEIVEDNSQETIEEESIVNESEEVESSEKEFQETQEEVSEMVQTENELVLVEDFNTIDKISDILDSMGIEESFTAYFDGENYTVCTETDPNISISKELVDGEN